MREIHPNVEVKHSDDEIPKSNFKIPNPFKQFKIYMIRDVLSKVTNKQYLLLNFLESPVLAVILGFFTKYIAEDVYIFAKNENIPVFLFMAVVVALFLGMTVSAEEIIKDRKILERERFLNLSRASYINSKVILMIIISAIQTISFVIVGNWILGIHGLTFNYWLVLFTTAVFANLVGLNISATLNSVVTIYILIPFILVPELLLSGTVVKFDKLHKWIANEEYVPFVGDMMTSRWAYEALLVNQFKNNEFEKHFYQIEKEESYYNFKQVYYLPKLNDKLDFLLSHLSEKDTSLKVKNTILLLKHELSLLHKDNKLQDSSFPQFLQWINDSISEDLIYSTKEYLLNINKYCSQQFLIASAQKEKLLDFLLSTQKEKYNYLRNNYDNESIDDLVQKVFEKNKIIEYNHTLTQNVDPIYQDPIVEGYFDYRAQFYAPIKHFAGYFFDTFYFNIIVVWLMTILAYAILYFNLLKKILSLFT